MAKLIQKQIKNFEPALEKFYSELKTNAEKYGVDLDDFESKVEVHDEEGSSQTKY